MPNKYKRLTKRVTTSDGTKCVTCSYINTNLCKGHCDGNCPVFVAILNQLCVFEDVYIEQNITKTENN